MTNIPTFKQLNERIIKKSINEIQEVTAYMIEVEYKQAGRQVVAVKFKVAFIPNFNIDQKQIEMFEDTQRLPSLVAELVKGGVHRNQAFKIWSQGWKGVKAKDRPRNMEFAEYVHQKIKLLEIESAKGTIDDKGAWLVAAIRDNYYYPAAKKRQSERRIQEQINQLQHEQKSIKQQQAIREVEILEPLLTDENLEKAFEKLKQSASFPSDWHNYAHDIKRGMEQSQTFTVGLQLQIKAETYREIRRTRLLSTSQPKSRITNSTVESQTAIGGSTALGGVSYPIEIVTPERLWDFKHVQCCFVFVLILLRIVICLRSYALQLNCSCLIYQAYCSCLPAHAS